MRCEFCDNIWYKEQQAFLDKVAAKLGVVCFRPNYHAQKGDANTVLFYTKEDHDHNCQVDKQHTQYTRAQAADLPYHIEDKYIYRDHFWCFENTDINGRCSMEFGNCGRLDLRWTVWRRKLEGAIRLAYAKKKQIDHVRRTGGYGALRESDEVYNNFNREMIEAFKMLHGQCFLGNVNYYDEKRKNIVEGNESVYEEYVGQKIYNFSFCVPMEDEELESLIVKWNKGGLDIYDVAKITGRVDKLGGINFLWY